MKKLVFLVLMFTLILGVSLNATTRSYYQEIVCQAPNLITTYVTNTLTTTTSPNYLLEVTTSADGYVRTLSTGGSTPTPISSLRVFSLAGAGPRVYVQFSAFMPTAIPATTIIRCKLTYIGTKGVSRAFSQWDFVVPSGTAAIYNDLIHSGYSVTVPPTPAPDVFGVPTLTAPTLHQTGVDFGALNLDWDYTLGAGIVTPTYYNVRYAISSGALATAQIHNQAAVVGTAYGISALPSTHYYWQVQASTTAPGKGKAPSMQRAATTSRADGEWSDVFDFTTKDDLPTTYDAYVTSNIPGVLIYELIGETYTTTGHSAPYHFTCNVGTSHTYKVMDLTTQVTPAPFEFTAAVSGGHNFVYTNPANTTGGGVAAAVGVIGATAGSGFTLPATGGVTLSGTAGPASTGGVIVFTKYVPPAKGFYNGYRNVVAVYKAEVVDQNELNGATIVLNYDPILGYKYVAIHWGGVDDGYYPTDHPMVNLPTPGYAFNGGTVEYPPYDFVLGDAPFTAAGYLAGALTIGPIPTWAAKAPGGVLELIMGTDLDLPVELSSFNAVATAQMFVNLQWTTESETDNLGFNVYRSSNSNVDNAVKVNFQIIAGTNSSSTHNYSFVDNSVDPQTTYYYWLEMVPLSGQSNFSNSVMVTTTNGQTPVPQVPVATELKNAYPNPFNVNTNTNIGLNVKRGENATLTIYNVLGQTVKTFVRSEGAHNIQWNGRDDRNAVCGSGIYFYKLSSASVNTTKKMVIVK